MALVSVTWKVDWNRDGDFSDTYEDISGDVLEFNTHRSIKPGKHAADNDTGYLLVGNDDGKYSPENTGSVLSPNHALKNRVIQGEIAGKRIFTGLIEDIVPAPFKYGRRTAGIKLVGLKRLLDQGEYYPPVYRNRRIDEIASLLVQELAAPIPGLSGAGIIGQIVIGTDTLGSLADLAILQKGFLEFEYVGDHLHGPDADDDDRFFYKSGGRQNQKKTTRWELLKDLIEAESGLLYFGADGRFVVRNRYWLINDQVTVSYTFDNDMQARGTSYQTPHQNAQFFNKVEIRYKPRSEATVQTTVWTNREAYIVGRAYGDTDGSHEVEVIFDEQTSATKLTVGSSTAATVEGNTVSFELLRANAQKARFVLKNSETTDQNVAAGVLSIVGNKLSINSGVASIKDDASVQDVGEETLSKTIRGIATNAKAVDLADLLLQQHVDNGGRFTSMGDMAFDPADTHRILNLDIGTRVNVQDDHLSHDEEYHVFGVHMDYSADRAGELRATFDLQRASHTQLARYDKRYQNANVTLRESSSADKLAQSFTIPRAADIEKVRLLLRVAGAFVGNLTLTIETDSSGDPSGTAVTNGTATTVTEADLTGRYRWVTFEFATAPSLSASTTYHLVLDAETSGLVSYWPLNETSGTRSDSHGSNDLTDNNTVTSNTGKQGNAGQFTAANSEYLDITDGSQSGLDVSTAFTFAGWVYLDSTGANQAIISKWLGTGDQRSYLLRIETSDEVKLFVSDDGTGITQSITASTFGALSASTWYFICARYDGEYLYLRVNTTDQTAVAYSDDVFDSTADFNIGAADGVNWPFDGRVDEVSLWNRALSDAEVTALYASGSALAYAASLVLQNSADYLEWGADNQRQNLHDTLVDAWTFDDSDDMGASWSGNNDLTLNNTPTSQLASQLEPTLHKPYDTQGIFARAIDFDRASSESASITDAAQTGLDIETDLTICCWIKLNSLPSDAAANFALISKWDSAPDAAYLLYLSSSDYAVFAVSNDGTATKGITGTTFGALKTGRWYFLAARHDDGTELKLRINDTDITPVAHTTGIYDASNTDFIIGAHDGGAFADVQIDEAFVFPGLLTDAELDFIYNSGVGRQLHEILGYTNGEMKSFASSTWSAETKDACFEIYMA